MNRLRLHGTDDAYWLYAHPASPAHEDQAELHEEGPGYDRDAIDDMAPGVSLVSPDEVTFVRTWLELRTAKSGPLTMANAGHLLAEAVMVARVDWGSPMDPRL